jgi:hypothetical protein
MIFATRFCARVLGNSSASILQFANRGLQIAPFISLAPRTEPIVSAPMQPLWPFGKWRENAGMTL